MNSKSPRALFIGIWLVALTSLATPATASVNPPSAEQIQEHLARLENVLTRHAGQDGSGWADLSAEKIDLLSHLRLLEPIIATLDDERAAELHSRLEALRERIRELATEAQPETELTPSPTQSPGPRRARPRPVTARSEGPAPVNDDCGSATPIGNATVAGDLTGATQDGRSSCDSGLAAHDVWYRYTAPADGIIDTILDGSSADVSIHAACPGTPLTEIACNRPLEVVAGQDVLIRVAYAFEEPFTLRVAPTASISGTVTDAVTGEPIPAIVEVKDSEGREVGSVDTEGGAYTMPVTIPPGDSETFYVRTRGTSDYLDEYYDNVVCDGFCFGIPQGSTPIELASGQAVAGIDFALDHQGMISGTVTDAVTGQPIPFASVSIRDEDWNGIGATTADSSGHYNSGGLPTGDHYVIVSQSSYLGEVYDDLPCPDPFGDCDRTQAALIAVTPNTTRISVDFALQPFGGIAGRVTHAATGEPIPMVDVQLFTAEGSFSTSAITDAAGEYVIGGVPPGTYFARTRGYTGFIDAVYGGPTCPITTGCDLTTGTPIPVAVSAITGGIDFSLDRGGRIEGTVTDVAGEALGFFTVGLWTADGSRVSAVFGDADGSYTADSLPTGTYRVTAEGFGTVAEVYDDLACSGQASSCDFAAGAPVAATLETVTAGVDFVLDRLGAISGTFTDQATGEPIPYAVAQVFDEDGDYADFQQPDSEGRYELGPLSPGHYFVTGVDSSYEGELYDSLPCPGGVPEGCDPTTGTPVTVNLNTVTVDIDFSMARRPMGTIAGTVRDEATGELLQSISMDAWDASGFNPAGDTTRGLGTYQISGLSPGTYFVTARDFDDYLTELHSDIPCPNLSCDLTTGTPVTVTDGGTATVDFALTRQGVITGTVIDSLFGDPIQSVFVRIWDDAGNYIDGDSTDGLGRYEVTGLDPGRYFVSTLDSDGYLNELYPNLPCPVGACDPTTGTAIDVDFNIVTAGIDFDLDLQQGISGRVTSGFDGQPLSFATLDIWDSGGSRITRILTGSSGGYRLPLGLGSYYVSTDLRNQSGVIANILYNGVACPASVGCDDPTIGTPIPVTAGTVTQGIDLVIPIEPPACEPSATRLCLLEGRFQVEVAWEDFEGNLGSGQAERLTDATGTFWFFTPDNIEIVVKVLDACYAPYDHFWVFAASLTSAGVELIVTDLRTGQERTYTNPLGNPAEPIQDTQAFDTCVRPAGGSAGPRSEALVTATQQELDQMLSRLREDEAPSRLREGEAPSWLREGEALSRLREGEAPSRQGAEAPRLPLRQSAPDSVAASQSTCTPSPTRLCVENERFQVEAFWRTPDGNEGMAQAITLSDATGYFWFFSPDNVEAVVKVLNACNLPSFENYWVFAAGLTDVEVLVRVTDTVTGQAREYSNPQGTPFRPVQDTGAFDACP